MPILMRRFRRHPGVDRDEFGQAALNWCRQINGSNDKVRSARFYWEDANVIAMLVDGEPGFDDYNPEPNPEAGKAAFRMANCSDLVQVARWGEAGLGTRQWEVAGRPGGTN